MGMSTHIKGFKPPDDKWRAMKAVYDACMAAKISIPEDVEKFFNDDTPDEQGVVIEERALIACGAARAWGGSGREGFEIDIKKLPADVTVVRVYNAW